MGGCRTIVAYRSKRRAVFLRGFAKGERDHIGPDELIELRIMGLNWLNAAPEKTAEAIEERILQEVDNERQRKKA
jgi:hypothetical protein